MHEIENIQWLTLMSEEDWNPYDETFTENERKAREKIHIVAIKSSLHVNKIEMEDDIVMASICKGF
jgi:hypothetical protein